MNLHLRFYNILDETIEDFSGHGIEDLRKGVLRTPIDAVRTLRDDPLRALRAIRFMYVAASYHLICSNAYPHYCSKGPVQFHVGARSTTGASRPRGQAQITAGAGCLPTIAFLCTAHAYMFFVAPGICL